MYLNAEQLTLANQAVLETFESTCVSWQVIPHWITGDPGQTNVPADFVDDSVPPAILPIAGVSQDFNVTLAMTTLPSYESLVNRVITKTVALAKKVDDAIIPALHAGSKTKPTYDEANLQKILDALIDGRAEVEKAGLRAPSCLITDVAGIKKLSVLTSGYPIVQPILDAANINSLHRVDIVGAAFGGKAARAILIGRRQRIPHGGAADVSPGEEPVDLAVSVLPSLECVGENGPNTIAFSVRIRYALRIRDKAGVVGLIAP